MVSGRAWDGRRPGIVVLTATGDPSSPPRHNAWHALRDSEGSQGNRAILLQLACATATETISLPSDAATSHCDASCERAWKPLTTRVFLLARSRQPICLKRRLRRIASRALLCGLRIQSGYALCACTKRSKARRSARRI
jgi:hypothetical protein